MGDIDDLDRAYRHSVDLRSQLDSTQIEIARLIASLAHSVFGDEEASLNLRTELYWHPAGFSVHDLAAAFGFPATAFQWRVKALGISHRCRSCGFEMLAIMPSRVKRDAFVSKLPILCEECREKERVEAWLRSEEYQRLRLRQLMTMPYAEYLMTHEWQKRRAKAREVAGDRCQVCNGKGPLDVHHRTYERRGCELPEDLTVLCRRCHEDFHRNGRLAKTTD